MLRNLNKTKRDISWISSRYMGKMGQPDNENETSLRIAQSSWIIGVTFKDGFSSFRWGLSSFS